jgi:uncharacterized membrane protein YhaH (DUF805 family)
MSFFHAIGDGFANYFSIKGISSRTQFWFWIGFVVLALCIALVIDGAYLGPIWSAAMGQEDVMAFDQDAGKPLSALLLAVFIIPTITIAARRLHDSAISSKWLFAVLTIIGILPILYFLLKKGTKGPNPYAPEID